MNAETAVFLRADTKLEPLAWRWYAWGHLVSPVQRAFNLAFRQVPMLRSFIANPGVHEAAAKNPKLIGGAFLELGRGDVPAVRALLERVLEHGRPAIEFAEEWIKLDRRLQKNETGFSLDAVYEELPPTLAGLVEATYDLAQHPKLRVNEELAWETEFAGAAAQEVAFCRTRDEQRNFFLNTPRLDSDERLVLPAAFDGRVFDLLSASRTAALPFGEIAAAFGLDPDDAAHDRLGTFFCDEPPPRNAPGYHGDGVRVRYFGHACVLLQTCEVSVLIDPFLTWDVDAGEGHLTFHDLPDRIDYVFLTHNHQDHFSVEALLQLRGRVGSILVPRNNANCLADPSMKLALRGIGHDRVRVMDPMERLPLPHGHLVSLPFYGEHADLEITSKHGLYVDLKGRRFLFLADSDAKDRALYRRIARRLGGVDHLFIGMECDGAPLSWLYGPYLSHPLARREDESRRLSGSDAARAWSIVEELGCAQAYVYAMAQEPWLRFVAGLRYTPQSKQIVESDAFVARCREAGIPAERLCGSRTLEL